jgi:hypothetical protein
MRNTIRRVRIQKIKRGQKAMKNIINFMQAQSKHGLLGDDEMEQPYEIIKGKGLPIVKCYKCKRTLVTKQKRVRASFNTGRRVLCCRCGLDQIKNTITSYKKSINRLNKLKRRIKEKDLVMEALTK